MAAYWVPKDENLQADVVRAQNHGYSLLRRPKASVSWNSATEDDHESWVTCDGHTVVKNECTISISRPFKLRNVVLATKGLHPERRKGTWLFTYITSRSYMSPRTGRTFLNCPKNSTDHIVWTWLWKVRVSFFAIYIYIPSNEIHNVFALIVY